jgi:succinoglycan biosynthesis transport protein ExoP
MFEAPRQISSAVAGTANTNVAVGLAPLADLDFRKIAGTIWRGKATILATTVGALALAFLYIVLAPHQYTATTQILIQPTDLRAVANDLTQPNQVSDAALMQVESQVRVITSDNVLRRVVQSEGLDRDPEFARDQSPFRAVLDDVMATLGLGRSQVTADKTLAALSELKRHIQVIRPERTYIVNVSVTSKDPEKAARIANAIAQAYLTDQTQVRADAANQISQSLTARLNELKDRVRESEERVEAFKARNNIVDANGQALSDQQLSDMNNQLAVARARTADAKARIDQVEVVQKSKGQIGAFPQAVQSATITALRSQYAEVVRREAEQMTTLGPRHPAVIEIEAQADRLQRNIEDEVNRIAASART